MDTCNDLTDNTSKSHQFYPPQIRKFLLGSYFWGLPESPKPKIPMPQFANKAVNKLFPDSTWDTWNKVKNKALQTLDEVYHQLEHPTHGPDTKVAHITLSPELQAWRNEQHKAGRTLRSKGYGLTQISTAVSHILGVERWPPSVLTSSAFYGCMYTNLLIGAHDPQTLYSNYCIDLGFFYEHGYHRFFPEFETTIESQITNPHARRTLGGEERREVTVLGLEYIKRKVDLEETHMRQLAYKTARVSRDELLAVMLYDAEICGMAAEAMARGFDRSATVAEFIAASPGTDVVDVGSDIHNSELFNSFLMTADVTDSGIVTEDALRNVYDGYSHFMAQIFVHQWRDPGARMCAILLSWHIQNERHYFLRRAILGYPKIRRCPPDQREADINEAFDERMHTTGFSRPLQNACDGHMVCDQVQRCFEKSYGDPLLKDLWYYMAEGPVQYASQGVIDEQQENALAEGFRVSMARALSYGLNETLSWLLCHANQHAWQVNRLTEASMFGSLLDDGELVGKLDRMH